jgi:hypothetical protein
MVRLSSSAGTARKKNKRRLLPGKMRVVYAMSDRNNLVVAPNLRIVTEDAKENYEICKRTLI